MCCNLMNGSTTLIEWCDGHDPSVSLALWSLQFHCYCFLHVQVPQTMRLCNSRIPKEHFVYYQTSQRKWVIIKVLYRCLRRYLLSWHRSRLGFVTLIVGEVSLGPLGNVHHLSLASIATNELVTRWCITERVKRLAGNEIELGIGIPTIKSWASNIPMTKRITYSVLQFDW